MTTYIFNEVKGSVQGKTTVIKAENIDAAIDAFGVDDRIKSYEKFKKMYFNDVYEVYESGNPAKVLAIVHKV